MRLILLISCLVVAISANPVNLLENTLEFYPFTVDDDILAFLERIRAGMGAPNEELGLPTLDPLSIKSLSLDLEFALVQ